MNFPSFFRQRKADDDATALRLGFIKAMDALKSAGCTRNDHAWYLLLATADDDKSCVLQHESSLSRAGQFGQDGHVCRWWLADDAVLIDPEAGFMRDDHESDTRWQSFVALMRQCRRRATPDAVVVFIRAGDLLQHDSLPRQACLLRQRINSLLAGRQVPLPCYVIVTACDALTGFTDFLAAAPSCEAGKVTGISLNDDSAMTAITDKLQQMWCDLQTQLFQRLQTRSSSASCRALLELPFHLARLQCGLTDLLHVLYTTSSDARTIFLRGIYLANPPTPQGRQAGMRLLSDIILGDPLPRFPPHHRRTHLSRVAPGLLAASAAALLMVLWTVAYSIERAAIGEVSTAFATYRGTSSRPGTAADIVQPNEALSLLERANAGSVHRHPWTAWIGMHDDDLHESLRQAYVYTLAQRWLPALSRQILQQLHNDNDSSDATFQALKAWLMLIGPRHRDMDYLQQWVTRSDMLATQQPQLISDRLRWLYNINPNFIVAVNEMAAFPVQQRLAARPLHERLYEQWQREHADRLVAIHPQVGRDFDAVFAVRDSDPLNMPWIYTAPAYMQFDHDFARTALEKLLQDQWVLGPAAKLPGHGTTDSFADQLRQRYISDYMAAWTELLSRISLRDTGGAASLQATLDALSNDDSSPLSRLLAVCRDHLVGVEGAGMLRATADKAALITTTLAALRSWMETVLLSGHAADAIRPRHPQSGQPSAPQAALALSRQLAPPVSGWVAELARASSASVANIAQTKLDHAWQREVGHFCQQRISGRYPFGTDAERTVSLDDFVGFFAPGGIEDNFVASHLGDIVNLRDRRMKADAAMQLSPRALQMLSLARQIREAFFASGNAGFAYQLTPTRMSASLQQFTLRDGMTRLAFSHGPRQAAVFGWPHEMHPIETSFTSLQGSTVSRAYEGVWGIYRFLDAAQRVSHAGAMTRVIITSEGGHDIEMLMTSVRVPQKGQGKPVISNGVTNPLQRSLLTGYECMMRLY